MFGPLPGPPIEKDPLAISIVIDETLDDMPNKSQEERVQALREIDWLVKPLLDDVPKEVQDRVEARRRKVGAVSAAMEAQERLGNESQNGNENGAVNITPEEGLQDKKVSAAATVAAAPKVDHSNDRLWRSTYTPAVLEPTSEEEVIRIVKKAYAENTMVRVVGSGHSLEPAVFDELPSPPTVPGKPAPKKQKHVLLKLTKMRKVTINAADPNDVLVTAEAGCNLGPDPENPDSTLDNSLLYTMNKAGYALPDLGGITHQTVGGFAMTGSSGGNTKASLSDILTGIRFVDGTGTVRTFSRRDSDPSNFFAAGVSMGLFGVVISITFQVQPTFFITGTQTISPLTSLSTNPSLGSPIDLLGPGTPEIPSMQNHLLNTEFTRCLWWPQEGLNRLTIWRASSIPPINPQTGTQWEIDPYEELPQINGSSALAQIGARTVLIALNLAESDNIIYKKIAASLLSFFNPITETGPGKEGPQVFTDWWYSGLPMDNEISDTIFPVSFTEIWMPIEETQSVMNTLHELFTTDFRAVGNFFTEVYAAKKSPFWMSPSYDGDVVRVNVNYFSANPKGSPEEFFARYWERFRERGHAFKCHWGKYTPEDFGSVVGERYRMHGEWLKVREQMDPKQIFVTPYWRGRLAIPDRAPAKASALSKIKTSLTNTTNTVRNTIRTPLSKVKTTLGTGTGFLKSLGKRLRCM